MSGIKPWTQSLGINQQEYDSWSAQTPQGQSVTFWSLVTNKIPVNDYLNWARDYYELPSVSDDFFSQAANPTLFQTMATVANWSAEMIPVHEWDGVVYVACVEPNLNAQWNFPIQYVLASTESLTNYWNQLNVSVVKEKTFVDIPKVPDEQTHTGTSNLSTPEGISFNAPGVDTKQAAADPASILQDNIPTNPDIQNENTSTAMMEGLNFDQETKIDLNVPEGLQEFTKTTSKTSVGLNFGSLDQKGAVPEESPVPTPAAPDLPQVPDAIPEPFIEPPAPAAQSPTAVTAQKTAVTAQTPAAPAQAPAVPTPAPAAPAANTRPEKSAEDAAIYAVINELNEQFEHCVVFIYQNQDLLPWKWDESWSPQPNKASESLDLTGPSVFRVVHRTKHPYHGYVIDSPMNSEFFKIWGLSGPPKHVTVTLLKSGSHSLGMLMVTSNEDKGDQRSLEFVEAKTDQIVEIIHKQTTRAA